MKLCIDTKRLKEVHFISNENQSFDIEIVYFPSYREHMVGYMKYCDTVHSITNLEKVKLNGLEIDMEESK